MPGNSPERQDEPDTPSRDISQLVTARLTPRQPRAMTSPQQVAYHWAEIQRLSELAHVLEQAITALVVRMHMTAEPEKRKALEHNRADLQRFKDEMNWLQSEHERAIERLQEQQ